ncbi:MAG: hypothetical protein Q9217_006638 [Psora testacea]
MAFFNLPSELIVEIVENLDKEQDIYSLIRVYTRFYDLLDDYLYRYNIKDRRINVEGEFEPGLDEIFETVKVLVEFRANQNLESRPRSGGMPITAHEHGLNHPYDRVKALFFDCTGDSLHNTPKHMPDSLQIGRTWMVPSLSEISGMEREGPNLMDHIDIEHFSKSYRNARTSGRHKAQPDNLDLSFFPVLDTVNQPQISSLRTHVSDGPWSPLNIDSLIAGFSVVNEQDIPLVAERSAQIDPFPQLNTHTPKNPLKTEAGKLWADFGKPKGHPVAEKAFSGSASSEMNSLPEKKSMKVRGKNRWQPLKFEGL